MLDKFIQMPIQKKLTMVMIYLIFSWILMAFLPFLVPNTGRLIADLADRVIYFERGLWFVNQTPAISEYPQIPTALFGLNHIFSMWFDEEVTQKVLYSTIFSLEMIILLFFSYSILLDVLPTAKSNHALLLLLPTTLYFTIGRFDIMPALFCLLAFNNARKNQWRAASLWLALGTFTKWYPVLIFPGFLYYASEQEQKFQWRMVSSFALTSLIIMFLSYLQGGVESVLAPYQFHLSRSMEFIALPVLLQNIMGSTIFNSIENYFLLLFILQISGIVLVFFTKFDNLDDLTNYCIVVIGTFVLFSRIWSPQWLLWLIPFLIISATSRLDVILIVSYSVVSYLCFPIMFVIFGDLSIPLKITGGVTFLILLTLIIISLNKIKFTKINFPFITN